MKETDLKYDFVELRLQVKETTKDVAFLEGKVLSLEKTVDLLDRKVESRINEIDKQTIKFSMDLIPVKKIVYTVVGLVLLEFFGLLLVLVYNNTVK